MSKIRRQFTPEEKYSILQEAEREGLTETARKYNLAHSVLNYWKKKYLYRGKDGFRAIVGVCELICDLAHQQQ
jgi:transposase-like protein